MIDPMITIAIPTCNLFLSVYFAHSQSSYSIPIARRFDKRIAVLKCPTKKNGTTTTKADKKTSRKDKNPPNISSTVIPTFSGVIVETLLNTSEASRFLSFSK
jgi:hypothetical protein